MGRLEGKVAIVMGATRQGDMGQAIARRFLEEGARVVVSGRGREGLDWPHQTDDEFARPAAPH